MFCFEYPRKISLNHQRSNSANFFRTNICAWPSDSFEIHAHPAADPASRMIRYTGWQSPLHLGIKPRIIDSSRDGGSSLTVQNGMVSPRTAHFGSDFSFGQQVTGFLD
jgi:hypothetical protein